MDFVHGALTGGRTILVLKVVNQRSRQSPTLEVGSGMPRRTVATALDRGIGSRLEPASNTVDHGAELRRGCWSTGRSDGV